MCLAAATLPAAEKSRQIPAPLPTQLLAKLPDCVATPDGMAIASDGALIVACPNFADPGKPACLLRLDARGQASKWMDAPVLPETGVARPMGIDFGPDGDLYVCDNQGWSGAPAGAFKGRVMRLRIRNDRVESATVIAHGMEHPNGVRVRDGFAYVTQSMMTKVKDRSGRMVSAVYRFRCDDRDAAVANTREDPQIIATFLTQNRFCQYGADGLVFDRAGRLYVGNFGDGKVHRLTFDAAGKVRSNRVFARTDFDTTLDPAKPDFLAQAVAAKMRTTDGLAIDEQGNIYVADFSNNAIARITPSGEISVLAQNGDADGQSGELNQPGEPIVWRGKLVVTNFDAVVGPDKVNTRHDQPATISALMLP